MGNQAILAQSDARREEFTRPRERQDARLARRRCTPGQRLNPQLVLRGDAAAEVVRTASRMILVKPPDVYADG
jgi:hypothetical protein